MNELALFAGELKLLDKQLARGFTQEDQRRYEHACWMS